MIVDAFLWNGETEMGELRVAALGAYVDRMVAVSCTLTHQSDPAPKIPPPAGVEWLACDAIPIPEGRGGQGSPHYQWIERQHRNAIVQLAHSCGARDVVLVSDVDEIPFPGTIPDIVAVARREPCAVPMRMHGFALDYLYPTSWVGTTASTVAALAPQAHRDWRYRLPAAGAGVHLSWMGTLDEKRRKLASFSHAELHDLDVEHCFSTGTHANGEQLRRLTRDETLALDWPVAEFAPPDSWWSPPSPFAPDLELIGDLERGQRAAFTDPR